MSVVVCGDANPAGNVALTYKGGCRVKLDMHEAYRCTGCGGWFHKDCIMEHFKLEADHDWGRQQERERIAGTTQELADRLITTLDSLMPSEKADAIVRDVATELYTDVLGVPGEIVIDTDQPTGMMHGGFGQNGRRAAMAIAKYKFKPEPKQ